ncbi:DUF3713 domain-containing protein [Mycoplasmoides genitalium]
MKKLLKKSKFWWFLLCGLSVSTILVACSTPTNSALKTVFSPTSTNFFHGQKGSLKEGLITALKTPSANKHFVIGPLLKALEAWYENNEDKAINKFLKDTKKNVDDQYKNTVNGLISPPRNRAVFIQQDLLDKSGGSEASWKSQQLFNQLISDFTAKLFAKDFLVYKPNGQLSTGPYIYDELSQPEKWKDFGFQEPRFSETNDALFAKLQAQIFNLWVEYTDPTLISQATFKYAAPQQGLGQVYNTEKLKDKLTPSYAFPFFPKDGEIPQNQNVGNKRWEQLIEGKDGLNTAKTGLEKYILDQNQGNLIDFPTTLSDNTQTKQIVDSLNIVDQLEAANLGASLNLKLDLLNQDKDQLPTIKELNKELNNTIVVESTKIENHTKSNTLFCEHNTTDSSQNNLKSLIKDAFISSNDSSNLGKLAKQIHQTTTSDMMVSTKASSSTTSSYLVWDAAIPNNKTNNGASTVSANCANATVQNTSHNSNNQLKLRLVRNGEGVAVIGIDGGSYYLTKNSSSKTERDIEKQKQFLMWRAFQVKTNTFKNSLYSFSFPLNETLKTWFEKNQELILVNALINTDFQKKDKGSDAMQKAFNDYKELMQKFAPVALATNVIRDLFLQMDALDNKLTSRTTELNTNVNQINPTSWLNGLSSHLPYVRKSGHYEKLNNYFLFLITKTLWKKVGSEKINISENNNKLKTTKADVDKIRDEILSDINNKVTEFVNQLKVTEKSKPNFSNIILVDINNDQSLTNSANWSLNALLDVTTVNPLSFALLKNAFTSNQQFEKAKKLFEEIKSKNGSSSTSSSSDADSLAKVISNYYYMTWSKLTNKAMYGNPNNGNIDELFKKAFLESVDESGFNVNFKAVIDHYRFIFTLQWLIENNLKNFKDILQANLKYGEIAYIAYDKNIISNNTNNPQGIFGSVFNYENDEHATTANANQTIDPNNFFFKTKTSPNTTPATTMLSTRQAVSTSNNGTYGFTGLNTTNSSMLENNTNQALLNHIAANSLKQYGSKDDLKKFISETKDQLVLDNIARQLSRLTPSSSSSSSNGKTLSAYFQVDAINNSALDFKAKQALLLAVLDQYSSYFNSSNSPSISKRSTKTNQKFSEFNFGGDSYNYLQFTKSDIDSLSLTSSTNIESDIVAALVLFQASDTGTQQLALSAIEKPQFRIGDKRIQSGLNLLK